MLPLSYHERENEWSHSQNSAAAEGREVTGPVFEDALCQPLTREFGQSLAISLSCSALFSTATFVILFSVHTSGLACMLLAEPLLVSLMMGHEVLELSKKLHFLACSFPLWGLLNQVCIKHGIKASARVWWNPLYPFIPWGIFLLQHTCRTYPLSLDKLDTWTLMHLHHAPLALQSA